MIKTVFFDLDGTLLPMDMVEFVKGYLERLSDYMAPYGYESEKLVKCIWVGTEKMSKNCGSETNEAIFWKCFTEFYGEEAMKDRPIFEEFYKTDFQNVAAKCGFDPRSAETLRSIHEMGLDTVLATNPIFPATATESRVRWAGLQPSDFLTITSYENSSYCKPNLQYYRDILQGLNLKAEECVMVGNDMQEDMIAKELGMQVFLMTDCLVDRKNSDINSVPHGSHPELLEFLRSILS